MDRQTLQIAVEKAKDETKEALQSVYGALNSGQQKKILKNDKVRSLFDLYGVEYEE